MQIIPAIDLLDGKIVRLYQGRYDAVTEYRATPQDQARIFRDAGARRIHVVDLDGAKAGRPVNIDAIESIRNAVEIEVELGGGIRTLDDISTYRSMGIEHLILGTKAIADRPFLAEAIQRFGDALIVGVDVRDGKPAISGWVDTLDLSLDALFQEYATLGVGGVIYTDIHTDGAFTGVDQNAVEAVLNRTSIPFVLSGGVSSIEDIRTLTAIGAPHFRGVIVGKAIYDGRLDLRAALSLAENRSA